MELVIVFEDINDKIKEQVLNYAQRVRKEMTRLARKQFSKMTAINYIANLSEPEIESSNDVVFTLEGFLPVALEDGMNSFDMKPGLLRSSKAKISKSGVKYLRVPVRKLAFVDPYLKGAGVKPIATVTSNSPANSWIHPGLRGKNLFGKALEKVKF